MPYRNSHASELVGLAKENEAYIKRFIHPLPQEIRFKGVAYIFNFSECSISSEPATALEKKIIDDFKRRWTRRSGTALNGEGGLVIRVGLMNTMPDIQKAVEHGLIDVKYMAGKPNPKQAYAIAMEDLGGGKVNVYICGNDVPGLYYGLLTFDQLTAPLCEKNYLILPHVNIVDWPDIRRRGTWTLLRYVGSDESALKFYDDTMRRFSYCKMNLVDAWHVNVSEPIGDGSIRAEWVFPKEIIAMGKRYAVEVVPGTGHIPKKFRVEALRQKFPGAAGTQLKKEKKTLHLCQNSPDTVEFYKQFIISIARQYDLVELGMSEIEGPRGVCHCARCGGKTREAFVKETQNLMYAYKEARKVNPDFKIILNLTQGSYPHHFKMLQYIPKDVILNFYNGKMTYKTYFQRYNLPPSVMEFQRLGYKVGSTNSPIDTQMMVPFRTPRYCRLLCGEAEDRHLDFVMSQLWPDPFKNDFNTQAMAEFLWNSSGRTAEDFTTAWATRKGWKDPDEAAAIILMMEYISRGIHNCKVKDIVKNVVAYLRGENLVRKIGRHLKGKEWARSKMFGGFEYPTHDEMVRIRVQCEEAVKRAEKLGNLELLSESAVLKHWVTILEEYSLCMEKPGAEDEQAAIDRMKAEFKAIPEARKRWLAHKNLSDYGKRYAQLWFERLQKKWMPIFNER